jgi:SAM-dependent methyltransferase
MSDKTMPKMKILVAIANYGTKSNQYLCRLVEEYRAMPFAVDIVVLSNIPKQVAPDIEVIVGLPSRDPWSLPFGHKAVFAARSKDYDLFIYSEDDVLVTERNIRAFLHACTVLSENELAGFIRFEQSPDGGRSFPDVHGHFHWDPSSVRSRGECTFAFFTNEHAGLYMLTREQLKRAIDSGGFLVEPHQGKYDLLCAAATDPYTQCGSRKLVCISQIDDFLVHHVPDKYAGKLGASQSIFHRQIEALMRMWKNGSTAPGLFQTETKLPGWHYSKNYYEEVKTEVNSLIPNAARSVLSLGCGWGAAEASLVKRGARVVALPLDSVISVDAESMGVELVKGTFGAARQALEGQHFDCLFISNVLHLVANPVELLSSFAHVLTDTSRIVAVVPTVSHLSRISRRIRRGEHLPNLGNYEMSGVHSTSHRVVRKWFRDAGFVVEKITTLFPKHSEKKHRMTLGLIDAFMEGEIVVVARGSGSLP